MENSTKERTENKIEQFRAGMLFLINDVGLMIIKPNIFSNSKFFLSLLNALCFIISIRFHLL